MSREQRPSPSTEGHHGEMISPYAEQNSAWAWSQTCGHSNSKFVLVVLAMHSDEFGVSKLRERELRDICGMSDNGLQNNLRNLQRIGLVEQRDGGTLAITLRPSPLEDGAKVRMSVTPEIRAAIMERDGCCVHCGALDDLEIDHITPRSKLGWHEIENLQVLCADCNQAKGDQ